MRTRDGVDAVDMALFRLYLSYDVSRHSTIAGGYGLSDTFLAAGGVQSENRFVEQYVWSGHVNGTALASRTRFEERVVDGNDRTAYRIREQVRVTHPLKAKSAYTLVGYNEIFFHVNETAKYARGFDQNRAFGGVSRQIANQIRFEIGYLNQYGRSKTGPAHMYHVLSTTVTVTF